MDLDVVFLSRLQFAFTIFFHYIFPPFSIGTGLLLVIYEGLYLIKKDKEYERITRFWVKIFAANFSLGVASGIVMEFEFGTNWATYSRFVGDIFGSPLAAEGIFAFFLESGFLAILLFGWGRVKPWVHFFSTVMVFIGSLMSAFWIIVANSWMHTPVAYELVQQDGGTVAHITSFWQMVFNPSTMVRFSHAVTGAFIQGSFLILSVSAFYLLKEKFVPFAKKSFKIALVVLTFSSLAQPVIGHWHGQVVAEYQPAKLAAFEGHYETSSKAPLTVIGWTDPGEKKTVGIKIPGFLSFLAFDDFNAEVKGLEEFPEEDWPNVPLVFQTYHLMVAIGMFFIALSLFSLFLIWRKQFFKQKWILWVYVFGVVLPVLANQLGWISAEAGRQPWIVQDLLRTQDAVSKSITGPMVLSSLILFVLLYSALSAVWIYVLNKEIQHGPAEFYDDSNLYQLRSKKLKTLKK